MSDHAARHAAADRLLAAECELRAAQDALRADDSDENRGRYRQAIKSLKAAEQAAHAAIEGWAKVAEA